LPVLGPSLAGHFLASISHHCWLGKIPASGANVQFRERAGSQC
jgi:hypothetical protein